ncbi:MULTISPECIES: hypothetical protein [unclassified Streptomyces]|uniref:hypothetical protein n=1 Tax=unclassified Streptomyces TaxID=2593676 RepID=UPI001F0C3D93|nr:MULTISPECIES: hypothetical protein [unclassified Streptomyces]
MPGDRVTVFTWRDMVWELGKGELRQPTTTKPGNIATAQLAVGLVLLTAAAGCAVAWTAAVLLVRRLGGERTA